MHSDSRSRSRAPGRATKAETVTYANNTSKWVLGTMQKIVSGGSTELDSRAECAQSADFSVSRFGEIDQTFGYNTDGTPQWSKDGDGHATTYSNWYRGIPKNVGYATGESASVAVSNTGTIDNWTDERGSTTTYDHDTMGRALRHPLSRPAIPAPAATRHSPDDDRLVDERRRLGNRPKRPTPTRGPRSTTRCCARPRQREQRALRQHEVRRRRAGPRSSRCPRRCRTKATARASSTTASAASRSRISSATSRATPIRPVSSRACPIRTRRRTSTI